MATEDSYNLARFKSAQASGVYERALQEIRRGRKTSHWMWFVFPQLAGLGFSATSIYYAIKNIDEAKAYLEDELLGQRLREICGVLLSLPTSDAREVFGTPDWMKLRSSLTLFDIVSPSDIFSKLLCKYFAASPDYRTLTLLRQK